MNAKHRVCQAIRGSSFVVMVAGMLVATGMHHASSLAGDVKSEETPKQEVRGFGEVTEFVSSAGPLKIVTFNCQSPEKAVLLLQKLGRDMEQSDTLPVRWETIRIGKIDAKVLVRDGVGAILPVVQGSKLLVITASKPENGAWPLASIEPMLDGGRFFDAGYKYPVYLDKFSRTGIGSWYPAYWSSVHTKGRADTVDDHFAYAQKLGLTIQSTSGDFMFRNLLPELRKYDRPYHIAQWLEWSEDLARMAPEELVAPGELFTNMPHYYGQISDGGRRLLQYRNWDFQNDMKTHVADSNLVDWLDPNGEVGPHSNYHYWDFSEANRQNLCRYLREERKYSLESLGEAWYGDKNRFTSWEQVRIPMDYSFFGFGEGDVLADKSWRIHSAPTGQENIGDFIDWSKLANDVPAYLKNGLAKGYQKPDFDDGGWAEFKRPGGELAAMHWSTGYVWAKRFFWRRGAIHVDSSWLENAAKAGRVYLTVAALNLSNGWKEPDRLWINGVETGCLSAAPGTHVVEQLDVTGLIKPGRNSIVHLGTTGMYSTDGPIFLTTRRMEHYPFSDTI